MNGNRRPVVYQKAVEKGIGRLNACPTLVCRLLVYRGGAGGFADCFSILLEGCWSSVIVEK
jgi:hypothetical protein